MVILALSVASALAVAYGVIEYIAVNATPLSEAIIGPSQPEYAVLELNGGACEKLGIKIGDSVIHLSFKTPKQR